jgi:hypothetical protein
MWQLLRMLVAYTCLVLVMAFVVLWVASYFWNIYLSCRLNSDERFSLNSERGQLHWSWHPWTLGDATDPINWDVAAIEHIDRFRQDMNARMNQDSSLVWPPEPSLIGFDTYSSGHYLFAVVMPHWFPILLVAIVGIIAKPRPKLKLGIRDLLIVTTILAIAMTVIALSKGRYYPGR